MKTCLFFAFTTTPLLPHTSGWGLFLPVNPSSSLYPRIIKSMGTDLPYLNTKQKGKRKYRFMYKCIYHWVRKKIQGVTIVLDSESGHQFLWFSHSTTCSIFLLSSASTWTGQDSIPTDVVQTFFNSCQVWAHLDLIGRRYFSFINYVLPLNVPESICQRKSLVVQWLGLCTFTAGATGSIPGGGTKILKNHVMQPNLKKKKKTETKILSSLA